MNLKTAGVKSYFPLDRCVFKELYKIEWTVKFYKHYYNKVLVLSPDVRAVRY